MTFSFLQYCRFPSRPPGKEKKTTGYHAWLNISLPARCRFYVTLGAAIYLFLHPGCETPSLDIPLVLSISIIGFMVVQLAGIINDSIIMAISNLGSLSNFEPRKKIEIFVCIGAIIYFTEVSWDIYSTYSVFSPHVTAEQITNCSSYATALKIYQGVILSHWGIVIFLFLLYLFWLDPFHLVHLTSRPQQFEDDLAELEKTRRKEYPAHPKRGVHSNAISCIIWLKQCCKKRGISTPRQQALRDLANAFEMLFEGIEDMDYTFLDIVSGFKLMSVYHEKLRERNKDPAELIIKVRFLLHINF